MDDLEFRIARLRLAPTDVLVVKVAFTLTTEQADRVRDIASKATQGANLLVLDANIDLAVLTREEIEARIAA